MSGNRQLYWTLGGLGALALLAGTGKVVSEDFMDKKDGLKKLTDAAKPISIESGIPIQLIVTQAAHESNFGRSGLATQSNNLFGIKAGKSWTGKTDLWPTWENVAGKDIQVKALFRKYDTWAASLRDWAKLIKSNYPKAYVAAVMNNSKLFFEELQRGGYATDPNYSAKLAGVLQSIEALI